MFANIKIPIIFEVLNQTIMTQIVITKQDVANEICNTVGCVDCYPSVYQAAYEILYKGRLTKKTTTLIKHLQSGDIRKLGYVPEDLLAKLKSILE